ncbi:hypothetical protein [Arthrobacter sp. SLBN-53]|uniref:hypothetical protein n=1 Tax=Arthrobacter sp. SLBN-53 TaxID=2768412 RepID=UPI00115129D6|nr:hypothetical protein [Arthrobacter sp. SLBN-53]TQK27722.1 hypothetical protein FBY28_0681 [Arthrobacter sp. SLBN-53]
MSTSLRVMDRVLTALVAVLILTGAAWVIGYGADVAVARDAAARIDPAALGRATEWHLWSLALGAGGVVLLLIGAWLTLSHLRPRSVRTVSTAHDGAVDLARLADAAAADLGNHPAVTSAKAATRTVSGRPVVRISAEFPVSTDSARIRRLAHRCAHDLRRAADTDLEFQLLAERAAK